MADIVTNTLQIGNDNLILRDADAQEKITGLKEDYTTIIDSAYVTDTASGSIASFPDGADGVPVKDLVIDIEPIQAGSGDPSPDNVRPISGITSAKVARTGKNLYGFGRTTETIADVTYTRNNDGSYTATGTATAASVFKGANAFLKAGTYIMSALTTGNNKLNAALYVNGEFKFSIATAPYSFVLNEDSIVRLDLYVGAGQTANITFYPQIELGSNATDYEPYKGETYDITIPTEAGTVYGGKLDVTKGTLTVDRAMVDLGTLTWDYNSSDERFYSRVNGWKEYTAAQAANAICSQYFSVSRNNLLRFDKCFSISTNVISFINIRDTAYSDAASFKDAMSGVQLAYELATPITVQLTAQQITTLLGTNNVWSDCGDTEVEYRADTKLYIEKLTAPTEDDMVADHAISENSFFMVGNTLYRAKTAIASGATITVGTNATKLSLSDALNALA